MAQKTYYDNEFKFTVEDSGTITAEGKIPTLGVKCGKRITPDGMQPGDQRGHLIAASEGGGNHPFNVTAQNGKLNQGEYKAVEMNEKRLARQGNDVQTSKTAYVSSQSGNRPDAYMVNDTITCPDGETQHAYFSFQNNSPEEQAQWTEIADGYDMSDEFDNPNPARENMSAEDYNSLMEQTENDLPSVQDEFDLSNSSESSFSSNSKVENNDAISNGEMTYNHGNHDYDASCDYSDYQYDNNMDCECVM